MERRLNLTATLTTAGTVTPPIGPVPPTDTRAALDAAIDDAINAYHHAVIRPRRPPPRAGGRGVSGLGDAYAAMQPPRKCICGEYPQGHPSGLCDACVAKRSKPATRQPCAGWFEQSPGRWMLDAGPLTADASGDPGSVKWSIEVGERSWAHGSATTLEAAQLAAEDALLAVADEIRRAVGR